MTRIPFNKPAILGREYLYLQEVLRSGHWAGDGPFSARCRAWLSSQFGAHHVHLTNSATGALELATILAALGPGDEVVMPAFAYVTCANAVALRHATPVFADIDPDTLNLDLKAAASAITPRTRALLVIHYAGIPCDMDGFIALANRHNLILIEDAAQAFMSYYRSRPAGTLGHVGVYSFHDTKNISSGEGGALLVNQDGLAPRAEVVHQKGTDRTAFNLGELEAYSWVDLGSSFSPSELTAAVLLAQFEQAETVTQRRVQLWQNYHSAFAELEHAGIARRPVVPAEVTHNGHIYYLLLENENVRDTFISRMAAAGVSTAFHYVPLDTSKAGKRYGRAAGDLPVTHSSASRLVRLPMWLDMDQGVIIDAALASLR